MDELGVGIAAAIAVTVLGGHVAGRLLGVRLSWSRRLLALAVGLPAGWTVAWVAAGSPLDGDGIDPALVIGAALLVAMAVAPTPSDCSGRRAGWRDCRPRWASYPDSGARGTSMTVARPGRVHDRWYPSLPVRR